MKHMKLKLDTLAMPALITVAVIGLFCLLGGCGEIQMARSRFEIDE